VIKRFLGRRNDTRPPSLSRDLLQVHVERSGDEVLVRVRNVTAEQLDAVSFALLVSSPTHETPSRMERKLPALPAGAEETVHLNGEWSGICRFWWSATIHQDGGKRVQGGTLWAG
jgi:hypothetical protein